MKYHRKNSRNFHSCELEYYQGLKRAHLFKILWDYEKETKKNNRVKTSEEKEVTLAIILKFKKRRGQKSSERITGAILKVNVCANNLL